MGLEAALLTATPPPGRRPRTTARAARNARRAKWGLDPEPEPAPPTKADADTDALSAAMAALGSGRPAAAAATTTQGAGASAAAGGSSSTTGGGATTLGNIDSALLSSLADKLMAWEKDPW